MAIVATAIIPINIHDDHTIEVLLLKEISECGCVNIKSVSEQMAVPLDDVKATVMKLVGEQQIECDEDHVICCVDKSHFDEFVNTLKH